MAEWFPERGLIAYSDEDLDIIRTELCSGCVRAREVESKPAIDAVRSALSWEDIQFVEKMAPAAIAMPRGYRMKIEYAPGSPPRGRANRSSALSPASRGPAMSGHAATRAAKSRPRFSSAGRVTLARLREIARGAIGLVSTKNMANSVNERIMARR